MQYGRKVIYTDAIEITRENIIKVLRQAMLDFLPNADDCTFLLNFEKGIQEKIRKKLTRTQIDYWNVENIANEITDFKTSFNWGSAITLVQRGEKDSGTKGEPDAISLLNECYEAENIRKKTQELARFVEICGVGYTYVDINTEYEEDSGDSYFKIDVLDPRYAFVVRSSRYADHRVMLGVTFRKDRNGNYYFTCFTKNERFEILNLLKIINEKTKKTKKVNDWEHLDRSGEENPLGKIPIIEWIRSFDRMGCFERQISEMNHLNLLVSNVSNAFDQNVQAIWHTNDVEFPTEIVKDEDGKEKEVTRKPQDGEWMQTFTSADGKTPFIKALTIDYDYAGMLSQIQYKVNRIKEKCNVPARNDNSGGSTGIAADTSTGYADAEKEAVKQDQIKYGCKMEEVKVVLAAIKESPYVPADSPLLKLKYRDMEANIKRPKDYELTTKVNFFATAVSHGVYGLHALKAMNVFEDVNQVWDDSKPLIEAYQKSIFEKGDNSAVGGEGEQKPNADRLEQDSSDQITNSPYVDGISTE